MKELIAIVAVIAVIGLIGYVILRGNASRQCEKEAAYSATANPSNSVRKELNLYKGYYDLCMQQKGF
ncbi:MAG: hypothetical protein A2126_03610 [Candidatus Woykebacteria bacterium GWB1_45_5]|uniref:Uncharacterized protein n=2 Tax=Candidatus Woykeibacteriota TaxID=1817899 RepID=A0A1G1W3T2_9BACT|nr:MAG: hypothetical protein A2113_03375 [Candidatus Woykebacteria bacterium GWA1_44_8]OGY24499.1 MAG: hypothetical protein A2126_03610 [Candidatus Woykebacteria bacterium GWB1_45_5]